MELTTQYQLYKVTVHRKKVLFDFEIQLVIYSCLVQEPNTIWFLDGGNNMSL